MAKLLDLLLKQKSRRSGARENRSQFYMLTVAIGVGIALPFSWVYLSERGEARYLAQLQELDARRARGEGVSPPASQNEAAMVMEMVNARRVARGERPFPYGAPPDVVMTWFREGASATLAAEAAGQAPASTPPLA